MDYHLAQVRSSLRDDPANPRSVSPNIKVILGTFRDGGPYGLDILVEVSQVIDLIGHVLDDCFFCTGIVLLGLIRSAG